MNMDILYRKIDRIVDSDSELERLVDDILDGQMVHWDRDRTFNLEGIIDAETLVDCPAIVCKLIAGKVDEDEVRLMRRQARIMVEEWCRSNDFGIDLWRKRIRDARTYDTREDE